MNPTSLFLKMSGIALLGLPLMASSLSASTILEKLKNECPDLQIVYSANINSEIEPCGCRQNPTGGMARRYRLQKNLLTSKEKLLVDSGDLFYKSSPIPPFLENQWNTQADYLALSLTELGIEFMVPGELDLVGGFEHFKKLAAKSKIKVLSANLFRQGDKTPSFKAYEIVVRNGKKIGIFGLNDESMEYTDSVFAKDHLETAKNIVKEIRPKVDFVFALTHLGYEKDKELADKIKGIDIIFGSHSQSFIINPEYVGDTAILQPSFRGQHLGILEKGENKMVQVDARFDDPDEKNNPVMKLVREAKLQIEKINKEQDASLMAENDKTEEKKYQTFASCVECHTPQYNFHKKTPHFRAFDTLVKAKSAGNFECLKCHTVGAQVSGGWKALSELVQNTKGKSVEAEKFEKDLQKLKPNALLKYSKTFINVQCENCHGPAGNHPFAGTYSKKVEVQTCTGCHTADRAPNWYKDGKLDQKTAEEKLKTMTCPK